MTFLQQRHRNARSPFVLRLTTERVPEVLEGAPGRRRTALGGIGLAGVAVRVVRLLHERHVPVVALGRLLSHIQVGWAFSRAAPHVALSACRFSDGLRVPDHLHVREQLELRRRRDVQRVDLGGRDCAHLRQLGVGVFSDDGCGG